MTSLPDLLHRITSAEAELHRATAALNDAVSEAREAGATWQQVGDALGVSRQAAAQRFTPHDATGTEVPGHIAEDLRANTEQLFSALASANYPTVYSFMTYTTGRLLSQRKLARVWQQVIEACGSYQAVKRTVVERYGRNFLLTFRLQHNHGQPVGQIMFNPKLKMTGMMIFNDDSAELPW